MRGKTALPQEVEAKLAAPRAEEPLETIIAQSLTQSLPPLREDIPAAYQVDIYPLLR